MAASVAGATAGMSPRTISAACHPAGAAASPAASERAMPAAKSAATTTGTLPPIAAVTASASWPTTTIAGSLAAVTAASVRATNGTPPRSATSLFAAHPRCAARGEDDRAGTAAHSRPRHAAVICAAIETAISAGPTEPMASPAGPWMRASAAASKPRAASRSSRAAWLLREPSAAM